MLKFLNLKPEIFGMDISKSSLKIAKLKKKRGVLGLASFGKIPIKPGVIQKGKIKKEDDLIEAIKKSLDKIKGEKLGTKYAVISLPEEKAFLQVIRMPLMEEENLEEAIRFEAENYIPLSIDTVYLDFQIIPSPHNHLDYLDVLIAALPKETINPYVSCLKKAGLQPVALEIESSAITRALIKNEESPFPVLVIDLGANSTSFVIFRGYSLRFTSSIPVSSQKFTIAISRTLKINEGEAEKLKLKYGLQRKGKEGDQVFKALIPALTDLTEQIKRHLNFYHTHASQESLPSNEKQVQKILLCGEGANLKGFTEFLSLELKIPVELGNPWINILKEPLKEVPSLSFEKSLGYTTALGLALRGIKYD
ncbi:type IV pilus assembly protein PilM [Candidatus Parcubacteria bacterium]|nr:type IV pilus assembly protein PilM [Candidatus Parcubacteria bacterium]